MKDDFENFKKSPDSQKPMAATVSTTYGDDEECDDLLKVSKGVDSIENSWVFLFYVTFICVAIEIGLTSTRLGMKGLLCWLTIWNSMLWE